MPFNQLVDLHSERNLSCQVAHAPPADARLHVETTRATRIASWTSADVNLNHDGPQTGQNTTHSYGTDEK